MRMITRNPEQSNFTKHYTDFGKVFRVKIPTRRKWGKVILDSKMSCGIGTGIFFDDLDHVITKSSK